MTPIGRRSVVLAMMGLACTSPFQQTTPPPSDGSAGTRTTRPPTPGHVYPIGGIASWKTFAPVPTPRSEVGASAIENTIYVVGGLARDARGDYTTDVVEAYNVTSNSWVVRAPLPQPVHHPAVTSRGNELWVIGGYTGNWLPLGTTYIYNAAANAWRNGPKLLQARGALGAAVTVDGTILAVGGYTNTNVSTVEALPQGAGGWQNWRPLSTGRDHLAVIAHNGQVYAIGGRQDNRDNLNLVEVFDRTSDTWRTLAPLPTVRSGIAAASYDGRIHVFGGEGDTIHPEHETFNPANGQWENLQSMPTPRHGLAAVTVGDRIYVLAGGTVPGYSVSGANEAFGR